GGGAERSGRVSPELRKRRAGLDRATGAHALGVNSHEIVRGRQDAEGRTTAKGTVPAVTIVVVEPRRQCLGALLRSGVRAPIGPLPQQGLNEALGLAIRARRVGPRAEMAHAGAATEAGDPAAR